MSGSGELDQGTKGGRAERAEQGAGKPEGMEEEQQQQLSESAGREVPSIFRAAVMHRGRQPHSSCTAGFPSARRFGEKEHHAKRNFDLVCPKQPKKLLPRKAAAR